MARERLSERITRVCFNQLENSVLVPSTAMTRPRSIISSKETQYCQMGGWMTSTFKNIGLRISTRRIICWQIGLLPTSSIIKTTESSKRKSDQPNYSNKEPSKNDTNNNTRKKINSPSKESARNASNTTPKSSNAMDLKVITKTAIGTTEMRTKTSDLNSLGIVNMAGIIIKDAGSIKVRW